MTRGELLELIRDTIKEYKGHHTMKNASPRPFNNADDEVQDYMDKNAGEGGKGLGTRGMEKVQGGSSTKLGNPNRSRIFRFENKNEKKRHNKIS